MNSNPTNEMLSTKASAAWGMWITVVFQINQEEILKTVVLAIVGGISSYTATWVIKKGMKGISKLRISKKKD